MTGPYVPYKPIIEDIPDKYDGSVIAMFYGKGGVGKTQLGGSVGRDGLIVMVGAGEMTLSSPEYKKKYPVEKRPRITYIREEIDRKTGFFTDAKAFDKVRDTTDFFLDTPDFKTLVIDDATAFRKFALNVAIQSNASLRASDKETSFDKGKRLGFPIIEMDDFQKEMNLIEWYLSNVIPECRERKKNLILIAHERHVFDPPKKQGDQPSLKFIKPGFTGKTFPDTVTAMFDLVWRMEVVNGTVFRAYTQPTLQYDAKTRWGGAFQERETDMNWDKIMERIK